MATAFRNIKNRAYSTLASTITAAATSLDVASGEGTNFPAAPFYITIEDEILKCTAKSTDTLTVTRAQESTTAAVHVAATTVSLNITAGAISDIHTAVNAIETIGANVVGPGSSTNNAIVRFDGTTGKIIQDYSSNAPLITNAGVLTALSMIKVSDNVVFGMGNAGTNSADFYYLYETADTDARILLAVAKVDADVGNNAAIILLCDQDAINVNLGFFNAHADDTEHRYWAVLDKDRDSYVMLGFAADDDAQIVLGGNAVLKLPAFIAGGAIDLATQAITNATGLKIDDLGTPDDNTNLDVSTSVHGLCPKVTNTSNFLKGDGTWAAAGGTKLEDADSDTKVDVEESADEDIIRMDVGGTEAFVLDAAGILDLPKQSGAGAYRATDRQYIPASQYVFLAFDTEVYDNQNEVDTSEKSGTDDRANGEGADHLVDDANSQFAASDVGRKVWNTTDETYTTITAFNDAGDVTLADAIFVNGEGYIIYDARFTATVAGQYLVTAHAQLKTPIDGTYMILGIVKNGTSMATARARQGSAGACELFAAVVLDLAASDYVQVSIYQDDATGGLYINNAAYANGMYVHKLS